MPEFEADKLPMRPSVVGPLLMVGIMALALSFAFYHRFVVAPSEANLAPVTLANPLGVASARPGPASRSLAAMAAAGQYVPEAASRGRVQELSQLSQSGNADALLIIAAGLTNAEPRIRCAAREAAVQSGKRDLIPALVAASQQTEDPEEKTELQNAADFLQLPSLTGADSKL